MMKNIFVLTLLFILFVSCEEKDEIGNYITFERENAPGIDKTNEGDKFVAVSFFESIRPDESLKIKPDTSVNLDPFKEYLKRDFYNGVTSVYFLQEVPGHIFRKNSNNGSLTRISGKRLVLNNAYPDIKTVDKVYYSSKVVDRKSLNVAASIIKLEIADNQIAELVLKDETASYLPDSLLNESILVELSKKLDEEDWDEYYLARGAVVSSITSKLFRESKFKKGVEAAWITANAEVYQSNEEFKQRRDVSLELISLKDYLLLLNLGNED